MGDGQQVSGGELEGCLEKGFWNSKIVYVIQV